MAAPRKYDLAAVIAERVKKHADIPVTLPDGTVVHIKAPESWGRAILRAAREDDMVTAFELAFVEPDGADRFEAGGGSLADFGDLITRITSGMTLPESQASTDS
jgi:hypothetical protein